MTWIYYPWDYPMHSGYTTHFQHWMDTEIDINLRNGYWRLEVVKT